MIDNDTREDAEQEPDAQPDAPEPGLKIVGIGASAGGLAALKTLFSAMPEDPGVAFVIVVHLSPQHESHLAELLQPHCPMPVQQVTETVELQANRVYVIPPNANLNTIDTHLRLSDLEPQRRQRAPIDHFFRTLATTHDGDAIGIILTGTGSDGTLGLRWIREQGGLAIAQAPDEAEYDGMPRSAIASGQVDLVLALEKIPSHLLGLVRTTPRIPIAPAHADRPDAERGEPRTSFGSLHAQMIEKYGPPSILLNHNHDLIHYTPSAGPYMELPGGLPTDNIFKLLREPFRVELRAALHAARESGSTVRCKPVVVNVDDRQRRVAVHIQRAEQASMDGFVLLVFYEHEEPCLTENVAADEQSAATVRELQAELELHRQRLQGVIEEYETGQEEMQAANEELQSTNEEMRSTLEELETSKEELQSMNEELATVSQENRHRVEELSQLSSDLSNLLAATDIATLFLDRELRIVRFTPRVGELFNVRHTDSGRPLSDLTHRLGYSELQDDARQVLARLVPVEREVQSENGRWYLTRILPYRTSDDRIQGVVITLIDIAERKEAEKALRESEERFRVLVEASSQAVWETNAEGVVVQDSPSWRAYTGQTLQQWLGNGWLNAIHPDDREHVERQWRGAIAAGETVDAECRLRGPEGEWRWTNILAAPIRTPEGSLVKWVGMNLDVTSRKQTEEALRELNETLEQQVTRRTTLAEQRATQLRQLTGQLAQAEEQERRRLAEVLHDQLQQMLVATKLKIGLLQATKGDDEQLRVALSEITDIVSQAIKATRTLSIELSPPVLYDQGLSAALEWLAGHMHDQHKLEVHLELEKDADPVDDTVRDLLFHATRELLLNVIKHAGAMRAALKLSRHNELVQLDVIDQGHGFNTEQLQQNRHSFGLFHVRERLSLLDGEMRIESRPGVGTHVTITAPDFANEDQRPLALESDGWNAPMDADVECMPGVTRVLLVDDHHVVRQGLAELLARHPELQVVGQASDGQMGVAMAYQLQPNVILMDVNMPKLNGIEATREIVSRLPQVHVIALSLHGEDEMAQAMLDAGAKRYLSKAGAPEQLVQAILAARGDSSC